MPTGAVFYLFSEGLTMILSDSYLLLLDFITNICGIAAGLCIVIGFVGGAIGLALKYLDFPEDDGYIEIEDEKTDGDIY